MTNEEMNDYGIKKNTTQYFRFNEGENKIRVLTDSKILVQHWINNKPATCYGISKGCPFHVDTVKTDKDAEKEKNWKPSIRFACYILDKNDGQTKMAELPSSVQSQIDNLKKDSDWTFTEFPMPYDIKVTFNKEEAPANKYKVLASPKREPVPSISTGMTPAEYVQKKKDLQIKEHTESGEIISQDVIEAKNKGTKDKIAKAMASRAIPDKESDIEYPTEDSTEIKF